MTTKSIQVSQVIIDKAKERRFQSPNQYILYLMEYEEANRKYTENAVMKSHNSIIAFLEIERLEMANLNKSFKQLIEKYDIELQLSARERKFLEAAIAITEEKGEWTYKE